MVVLMPKSIATIRRGAPGGRLGGVGRLAGDGGDEVDAVGAGFGGRSSGERGLVGGAERAGHGAEVADVAGQAAGVDAGDAGHAVALQQRVEIAAGTPVRVTPGQLADDDAATERPAALVVGVVDAVVADVGVGEGDDLTGVGRVGDDLLVAGEHGVEDHLARRHAPGRRGADGFALEDRAVGQHQRRRCDG